MDFLHRLKEFTQNLEVTPPVIRIGSHTNTPVSVAIRPSPSAPIDRHLDRGKVYPFAFQLLVFDTNHFTCYELIQAITKEYESLSTRSIVSSDNSFSLISFQCTTVPNHVEDRNEGVLYSALFEAELYIQGGS